MIDKASNATEFVLKLVYMLKNDKELVGWNQSKTQIILRDVKLFTQNVLPKYFRHNKLESFVRQLNMYNFFKVPGVKQNTLKFKHQLFYEGNQHNFFKIKRKKKNQSKEKGLDSIQQNLSILIKQKIPDNSIKNLLLDLLEFETFSLRSNQKITSTFQKMIPEMKVSKLKKYNGTFDQIKIDNKNIREKSLEIEKLILNIKKLEYQQNPLAYTQKAIYQVPNFKSPKSPAFMIQNMDQNLLEEHQKKEELFDYRSPSITSQLQPFFSINKFFVLNDLKTPPCIFKQDLKQQGFLSRFPDEASNFSLEGDQQSDY